MSVDQSFRKVLHQLKDISNPISPLLLYHFSDLSREEVAALERVWLEVPEERRLALVQDLSELADANVDLNPEAVWRLGLEDPVAQVRATCIEALWENESQELMGVFFNLLTSDPAPLVRAAAASALGNYVYLAELEELDARHGRRLEDALLLVATGNDELDVRRRAIEALGFSSRREVPAIIEAAYASPEEKLKVSALFAMSRSSDSRWRAPVLAELTSVSPALRLEAARAAGEIELAAAVPNLIEATRDSDVEVRYAAIWSLGQIANEQARGALLGLLARRSGLDEDEVEHVQDALDNLEFVAEMNEFVLLEADPEAAFDELEYDEDEDDYFDDDDPETRMLLN